MKKSKNKAFYICTILLYLVISSVAFIFSAAFLEPNVRNFYTGHIMSEKEGNKNDIVEIIIDDRSTKYLHPWALSQYVDMLKFLSEYAKPKIIGFDCILPIIDKNNQSSKDFFNQINKMDNLVLTFTPQTYNTSQEQEESFKTFQQKYSLDTDKNISLLQTPRFNTITMIQNDYYKYSKNFGSVNVDADKISGSLINFTTVLQIADKIYPSLALKMYLLANDTNEVNLTDKFVEIPKTGLKIPRNISFDGVYTTKLRYFKNIKNADKDSHFSHRTIRAEKILDSYYNLKARTPRPDDIPLELLKDKIIFIGEVIDGPTADVLKSPIAQRHPGVDVHATLYDNLIQHRFINEVPFLIQLLIFVLLQVLTYTCILRLKFLKSLLTILAINIGLLAFTIITSHNGYYMSIINPVVVQIITLVYGYSFKFIVENKNKEKIKQTMGKYLSQVVMESVVRDIDNNNIGGKRANVTVLFSDIRGFTSLSEKMEAEEVTSILNEYFSEMEPIITKYNGVINKFIGDAVMAIFGEPIQDNKHPENAVRCAYEMLKRVKYLREKWLEEGKPKIEIGVGINTGEVFIGNIGTENRMEYTVIGDTVNLASRIESYNKVYKTNLLVSSSTYSHIKEIADVIKISEVQIRGKAKKMNIYEILRITK